MVFFSKNKQTANMRIKEISQREPYYKGKKAILSDKQIPHISGWKTFKVK